ncbi:MAG TPA: helix-turn-helix domain-containing protein [Planctomycetota bacterium]|nr:helix-turn-helix domain-containing protein [Planctomycetota bacterium]
MSRDKGGDVQEFSVESGEFIRVIDVARRLGVSQTLVLRLLRSGALPGFKIGRCWIVHRSSLQNYLAKLVQAKDANSKTSTPQ